MSEKFVLGESSSIEGAVIGSTVRDQEHCGHYISSFRNRSMGFEIGDGCVLFADPSELEEFYQHMNWVDAAPYRESAVLRLRDAPEDNL